MVLCVGCSVCIVVCGGMVCGICDVCGVVCGMGYVCRGMVCVCYGVWVIV